MFYWKRGSFFVVISDKYSSSSFATIAPFTSLYNFSFYPSSLARAYVTGTLSVNSWGNYMVSSLARAYVIGSSTFLLSQPSQISPYLTFIQHITLSFRTFFLDFSNKRGIWAENSSIETPLATKGTKKTIRIQYPPCVKVVKAKKQKSQGMRARAMRARETSSLVIQRSTTILSTSSRVTFWQ